jgi:hypothetical protein
MLIAAAALATVEIDPPEANAAPTISGNVYVSPACSVLVLTIKLSLPAAPPDVIR